MANIGGAPGKCSCYHEFHHALPDVLEIYILHTVIQNKSFLFKLLLVAYLVIVIKKVTDTNLMICFLKSFSGNMFWGISWLQVTDNIESETTDA